MENRTSLSDWPKLLVIGVAGGLTIAAWNGLPRLVSRSADPAPQVETHDDDELLDVEFSELTSEAPSAAEDVVAAASESDEADLADPIDDWRPMSGDARDNGPDRALSVTEDHQSFAAPTAGNAPETLVITPADPRPLPVVDRREVVRDEALETSVSAEAPARGRLHRLVRRPAGARDEAPSEIPAPWAERLRRLEEEREVVARQSQRRRSGPPAGTPEAGENALRAVSPAAAAVGAGGEQGEVVSAIAEVGSNAAAGRSEPEPRRKSTRRVLKGARLTGVIEIE